MRVATAPMAISSSPAQTSLLLRLEGFIERAGSLRLDAALFHDALPLLHFLLDEGGELGWAHLHDLGTLGRELLLNVRRRLHLLYRLVQSLDDRRRRAGRRPQAPPVDGFVSGDAGLGHSRH